jgi:hypothetical protein
MYFYLQDRITAFRSVPSALLGSPAPVVAASQQGMESFVFVSVFRFRQLLLL